MNIKYWILAARPKTLPAGTIPVLIASVLAYAHGAFQWIPALLCLLFALLAQIASNFSNDYFDFVKKTDNEQRIGPARAVASGWISPKSMLLATGIVIFIACLLGLGLIFYAGWWVIVVGIVCVISLLAYTAGPFPLAYNGLGDVFVFVFFGLVAVCVSYYIQVGDLSSEVIAMASAVGLCAVNILILNNYRDYDNDLRSGKRTTIVLFGKRFGEWFYFANGLIATIIVLILYVEVSFVALLPLLIYLPIHLKTWNEMKTINQGIELNKLLGSTARNLMIYGIVSSFVIVWIYVF
jgi:1,4-dihydroxy-2-naphthoate octaprenyltransferase